MDKWKKKINMAVVLAVLVAVALLLPLLLFLQKRSKDNHTSIRIIATSDLHGKMLPFDYSSDSEDKSGSVAQLYTAVKEYRNKDTFLVDIGDSTQDNSAEIFLNEETHPMIQGLNMMNYDLGVLGNHEFDYTPDDIDRFIDSFNGTVLTGNLYRKDGSNVCYGYKVIEKNGVRVAFIGMTTPNSAGWSDENKAELKVTDVLFETRQIIDKIKGEYDILVGLYHLDIDNEFRMSNSGVTDICNACPEFDIMIASHGHRLIEGEKINGVLVVENKDKAQTMSVIDIDLKRTSKGWKIKKRKSQSVDISVYDADQQMCSYFEKYDKMARKDAESVIGTLEGGDLVPDISQVNVPAADQDMAITYLQDTPEMELINKVMMKYADCDISCNANMDPKSNIKEGYIHKCDATRIYKYQNNLWKVHMTGKQLKQFLEENAKFYETYKQGDKGVAVKPDSKIFNYYLFEGIKFDIDVSQEEGHRIKNLTMMDGKPIEDIDEMDIAVNNYLANTIILSQDSIYKGNNPKLVEADINADMGGIREMIVQYIKDEPDGTITSECDNNWKLIGY